MGRPLCTGSAAIVYHVLNRANARMTLFAADGDYAAFERVLTQACGGKTGTFYTFERREELSGGS